MATNPFAYNTGTTIGGTIQVGTIAVGTTSQEYSTNIGGLKWWMGPDQSQGYVITVPVSGNTQPTPFFGQTASIGFYRTDTFTDEQFISLAQYVSNEYGTPQTFTDATEASSWLTLNGFWNSYGVGTVIGPYYLQYNYTNAPNDGWLTFPNHNIGDYNTDPNLVGQSGYAIYINHNSWNGTSNAIVLENLVNSTGYLTLSQNTSSAVYSFSSPNGFFSVGGTEYAWDNGYGSSQLGTLTLVSSATTSFNNVDPVYITVSSNQSFTINSSDFTNFGYGYGVNNQSNNGFDITLNVGTGEGFFGPNLSLSQGGSSIKSNEILNFWNNNALTVNNNAYLFYANWGGGSTIGTSIVAISFYYFDDNNTYINIGLVDTTIPGWDTPGTNMYSTLRAVQGTFKFPATFSLYVPNVQDNDSWC